MDFAKSFLLRAPTTLKLLDDLGRPRDLRTSSPHQPPMVAQTEDAPPAVQQAPQPNSRETSPWCFPRDMTPLTSHPPPLPPLQGCI
ncbi:hypothetical protein OH77DRAFT_966396 [Trametes cingulata]|nr:hypothetical protein OH77DRAFT_966396 [Trametes cingulata]